MVLPDCSGSSFLLQATASSKAHNASTLTDIILELFLFMMSFFLFSSSRLQKPCHPEQGEGYWSLPVPAVLPPRVNTMIPRFARDDSAPWMFRTEHFTANRRLRLDALPPLPVCDCSFLWVVRLLWHAAWTTLPSVVLPALTGRCNRSAACGDLPRSPGTTAASARRRPTDYSVA